HWTVDDAFLASTWRCRWGDGCVGIADEPTTELQQGCCTYGAELLDEDEAMRIAALAATIEPERFAHHDDAAANGVLTPLATAEGKLHTRVVDGACIFFNPVRFAGGVGCALHLAAETDGESVLDWKPSVCWQLPLKVDRLGADAHLRAWRRDDWGPGGSAMAWCCTEPSAEPSCYTDPDDADAAPVIDSLAPEIEALVGTEVYVTLRRRIGG
ncbi:MAG: hypothetical protein HKN26_12685, partial [Acidimicrobiales bacterium]|nr:hypothetical protein [Acidimicrobiales bacterium]